MLFLDQQKVKTTEEWTLMTDEVIHEWFVMQKWYVETNYEGVLRTEYKGQLIK